MKKCTTQILREALEIMDDDSTIMDSDCESCFEESEDDSDVEADEYCTEQLSIIQTERVDKQRPLSGVEGTNRGFSETDSLRLARRRSIPVHDWTNGEDDGKVSFERDVSLEEKECTDGLISFEKEEDETVRNHQHDFRSALKQKKTVNFSLQEKDNDKIILRKTLEKINTLSLLSFHSNK